MSEKYELISKEILDRVCSRILEVRSQIVVEKNEITERDAILKELSAAYAELNENRTQCNVKPEGVP